MKNKTCDSQKKELGGQYPIDPCQNFISLIFDVGIESALVLLQQESHAPGEC